MKKRLLALLPLLILLVIAASASADQLVLPSVLKEIGPEAFMNDTSLDEVILPEGLETIGDYAFAGSSVTRIYLPESITNIGLHAFDGAANVVGYGPDNTYASDFFDNLSLPFIHQSLTRAVGDFLFSYEDEVWWIEYQGTDANIIVPMPDFVGDTPIGFASNAFRGNKSIQSIKIPEGILWIGSYAFEGCESLKTIHLPESMRLINDGAFSGCTSLEEINLPDGVEIIGNKAFLNCSSLTSIIIPDSVPSIGYQAFQNCSSLTSITLSDGVKFIASSAFSNCSSLTSITIPDGVKAIGSSAFSNCSSLTSIIIPNGVTSIGSSTFSSCNGLTSISIPESVTSIGSSAFWRCSNLLSITIPDSVTSIGSSAFINCPARRYATIGSDASIALSKAGYTFTPAGEEKYELKYEYNNNSLVGLEIITADEDIVALEIPDGVTSIADSAFEGCSSLASITIPDGMTSIGSGAFRDCSSLTSITIPDGVTSINDYAFYDCSSLTSISIPDSVTSINDYAFDGCSSLTSITIPDGVTSIGSSAFWRCSNLLSITIPDSVTSIGSSAFYNCPARRYATIGSDASIALSKAGYTFTPAGEEKYELKYEYNNNSLVGLEIITADEDIVALEIPDGVTSITDYAFLGCSSLASITIPDGMTSIGSGAFYDCSSLTSITIPDGVTSINDYAFYDCSSLTSISIPDSVTSIGDWAFFDCKSLTSITIPDSVTSISNSAFSSSLARMYATLGSDASIALSKAGYSFTPIGEEKYALIYLYTNNELSGLRILDVDKDIVAFEIPDGVTNIGNYAFCECSSLTSITIPDGMTSIGDGAFYDCSSLTSITIPDGVTSINDYAFYDCSRLTSISIPDSVTSINDDAFHGCSSLTSITIPNGVTSIGDGAFWNCSSLTSITIPNGVTSIGDGAFWNCSSLTSISIPDSVTSIGSSAFINCPARRYATIGSDTSIALSKAGYTFTPAEEEKYELKYEYNNNSLVGLEIITADEDIVALEIPDGVTSIGSGAFYDCSSLTSISIPDSVTSIGDGAFYDCSSLTSITIPSNVISISEYAFQNCDDLTIYGEAGSYAEQYANDNNIPFVAVDLVHTVRVSGSLACANMNLPYGQTVQVSGTAYSVNAPLSRVTLTIEGYNIENDENDRYATVDLSGQNLSTISLADYPALSLDASREPLNTPGTYVVKLWAKANGMTKGMLLDSMSVTVLAPDSITLSGTVATASGSPIPGAIVMVADSKDTEKIIATVITGKDGRWSVSGLDDDKDYIVTYSHNDYAFDTTSTNPVGSVVTGTLNGEDNGIDISFTMTQNGQEVSSIVVGTTVDFVISAPGASYVRLVVDGKAYEECELEGGRWTLHRTFTLGGNRMISFQAKIAGENDFGLACTGKPLSVTAVDETLNITALASPEVDPVDILAVKQAFTLSWKRADNAEGYHVYLYAGSQIIWEQKNPGIDNVHADVPGLRYDGTYTAVVVAYGYGYNQSEASITITVSAEQPAISVHPVITTARITDGVSLVGEYFTVQIRCKDADSVRLLVDGEETGTPNNVVNGANTIHCIVYNGGDHQIGFVPYWGNTAGEPYSLGTVHFNNWDNLNPPKLTYDAQIIHGQTKTVTWPAVEHANAYHVYLMHAETEQVFLLQGNETSFDLTPNLLTELGDYTLRVVALGRGYNASETRVTISTVMPQINFSITSPTKNQAYVKGDRMDIQVHNPDNYNIAIKVTSSNGGDPVWIPADGSTANDTEIKDRFLFYPAEKCTYTFEAMAWPNAVRGTEEQAWRDSSKAVSVSINGPIFRSVSLGGNNGKNTLNLLRSAAGMLTVCTNNGVSIVSVYVDNADQPTQIKTGENDYTQDANYNRTWTFDLALPEAGKYHTYRVVASDDTGLSISQSVHFYCVADAESNANLYTTANHTQAYSYPTGNARDQYCAVDMMITMELLGTYGSYSYVYIPTIKTYCYVPTSSTRDHIVYDTAAITLELLGADEDIYTYNGAGPIKINWKCSVSAINNLQFRLRIKKSNGKEITYDTTSYSAIFTPVTDVYTYSVELRDTEQNIVVKKATALGKIIVYSSKSQFINERSVLDRTLISTRAKTFESNANTLRILDVASASNNLASWMWSVISLDAESVFEIPAAQSDYLAENILLRLASESDDTWVISCDFIADVIKKLGFTGDALAAITDALDTVKKTSIHGNVINLGDIHVIRAVSTFIENHAPQKFLGALGVAKDFLPVGILVVKTVQGLFETIHTAHKYAIVSDDRVAAIADQLISNNESVIYNAGITMRAWATSAGRIRFFNQHLLYKFFNAYFEFSVGIGVTMIESEVAAMATGGTLLCGTIVNGVTNLKGTINAAHKAKWALEAVEAYAPTYEEALRQFNNGITAATYNTLVHATMTYQQLILSAYESTIEYMKEYDKGIGRADYDSWIRNEYMFLDSSNNLLKALDDYWTNWLQDVCPHIDIPLARSSYELPEE